LALNLFVTGPLSAAEPVLIRVGLSSGEQVVYFQVERGEYLLKDLATGLPLGSPQPGEEWKVEKTGGVLRLTGPGGPLTAPVSGPVELVSLEPDGVYKFKGIQYREGLRLLNDPQGILAVNIIDIEDYLYGVVGQEMGNYAEMEALKAQAVASRSYALSARNPLSPYDVGINTMTQVYGGYTAELTPQAQRVVQAVDLTRGQVLYYGGRLVQAFFHSNAGGHTENAENVWSEPVPYLKAVPSPSDSYALDIQGSQGWPANTYQWRLDFTKSELGRQLDLWNARASASQRVQVGNILDINISYIAGDGKPTPSGRAQELAFVGDQGTKTFTKDGIRQPLGLKSTLFQMEMDSQLAVVDASGKQVLYSKGDNLKILGAGGKMSFLNGEGERYSVVGASQTREIPKIFERVSFIGRGYGHGVGMSQWGARGMAKAGYNYQQILEHYYGAGQTGSLRIEPHKEPQE